MSNVDRRVKNAVSIVAKSANSKIGPMSATYAAQVTCPTTCPLRGAGCYAETGATGFSTRQRNDVANAQNVELLDVIRLEADGIRSLAKNKNAQDLRVHVVGDSPTPEAARITSAAMQEYRETTGKRAYTYTHAWRDVARDDWGNESVLASCEDVEDARTAMDKGYAAAIVVAEHTSNKAWRDSDVTVIPCPNQTRGVQCKDCGLCMDANKLLARRAVIAFAAHGTNAETVKATVTR